MKLTHTSCLYNFVLNYLTLTIDAYLLYTAQYIKKNNNKVDLEITTEF